MAEVIFNPCEVADLHNRANNTRAAATWFKERDIPYLAWAEDKLLLKLTDLPILIDVEPRSSRNWTSAFRAFQRVQIANDQQLRRLVDTDCLYAITGLQSIAGKGSVYLVTEYRFVND